jgi:hypothetical protein
MFWVMTLIEYIQGVRKQFINDEGYSCIVPQNEQPMVGKYLRW